MKKLLGVLIVVGAALALTMGTTGCSKPAAGEKDVKATAPAEQKLKKGEESKVDITLTRGKAATHDADLSIAVAPAGLKAELDPAKVAGKDTKTTVKLNAKEADPKEYTVTVTGKSKDSADIKAEFKVKVE